MSNAEIRTIDRTLDVLEKEVKELKIIVKKQREYLLMYESADRAIDRMIDKARGK